MLCHCLNLVQDILQFSQRQTNKTKYAHSQNSTVSYISAHFQWMTLINHISHIICWVVLRTGKRIGVKLTSTHFLLVRNTEKKKKNQMPLHIPETQRLVGAPWSGAVRLYVIYFLLWPQTVSGIPDVDAVRLSQKDYLTDMLKPKHRTSHKLKK